MRNIIISLSQALSLHLQTMANHRLHYISPVFDPHGIVRCYSILGITHVHVLFATIFEIEFCTWRFNGDIHSELETGQTAGRFCGLNRLYILHKYVSSKRARDYRGHGSWSDHIYSLPIKQILNGKPSIGPEILTLCDMAV